MLNRVFGNRYRIVEKLGIGGMAEVYKATDEVLGRTVAIKVMLPQYASDPTFAARFKQEAQSAANLQSPYIVNIYDWGYESSDGVYFIVMEYVRGTDLKTAIQQRGAINQRKAAEIGSQVCAALSVAHGYDIIHRDIKPHNIMVQPDGNAKVMDFGIARASGSSMTQTGSVLGTAYYVSPEQAQGKNLTSATDLYSLGIALYEAVTGKLPFDAPDAVSVALKQVSDLPLPPSHINPNIDPELETIILKALEKNPQNRFVTADQMRMALNNYLAGRPIDALIEADPAKTRVMNGAATALPVMRPSEGLVNNTAVMPSLAGQQQSLNVHSSARAREEEQNRRKRYTAIVGVVVGTILLVLAGVLLFSFLSGGEEKVGVPAVVGLTEDVARDAIEAAELKVGKNPKREHSNDVATGCVISTNPSKGVMLSKGSSVDLVISLGPEAAKVVKVPNLVNMTSTQAEDALKEAGLQSRRGDEQFSEDVEAGKVCQQNPGADEEVTEGTMVTFHISKGKDTVQLLNVVGAKREYAAELLAANDFEVAWAEEQYSDDYEKGIVMKQEPITGKLEKGAIITLTVSLGPQPVLLPNMVGKTQAQVESELRTKYPHLALVFLPEPTTDKKLIDKIMSQEPDAGASGIEIAFDSTVYFYYGVEADV